MLAVLGCASDQINHEVGRCPDTIYSETTVPTILAPERKYTGLINGPNKRGMLYVDYLC